MNATEAPAMPAVDLAHVPEMITRARHFLDHDVQLAHHYLDRLSALFAPMRRADPLLPELRPNPAPVRGGLAGWQLQKLTTHIDRHLGEGVAVEELALVVKLSKGHFCRAFKASFGETPHGYIMHQRLRRAQWLMLHTRDPLSQIASACGFTDQAHFSRLFRQRFGMTPLQWRRHWQGQV